MIPPRRTHLVLALTTSLFAFVILSLLLLISTGTIRGVASANVAQHDELSRMKRQAMGVLDYLPGAAPSSVEGDAVDSGDSRAQKNHGVVIFTSDSRAPVVYDDPKRELDVWTLTALHNHLYAKAHGFRFIYNVVNGSWPGQDNGDPRPRESGPRGQKTGYCYHPKLRQWRAATFCKLPVAWNLLMNEPDIEHLVFIDSDAVFRSPSISVWRHLDALSIRRFIGFIGNHPYDNQPNAGYWFVRRGRDCVEQPTLDHGDKPRCRRGSPRSAAVDFIRHWWDQDYATVNWGHMEEQATLRRLLGFDVWGAQTPGYMPREDLRDRAVFLADEWQFEERHPDTQMVLHKNHMQRDRVRSLAAKWVWDRPRETPSGESMAQVRLDDRAALKRVLDEMDVRHVDPSVFAEQMASEQEVVLD